MVIKNKIKSHSTMNGANFILNCGFLSTFLDAIVYCNFGML